MYKETNEHLVFGADPDFVPDRMPYDVYVYHPRRPAKWNEIGLFGAYKRRAELKRNR